MTQGRDRGSEAIDRVTQRWVQATGRRVDLRRHAWLDGPWSEPDLVGSTWVDREIQRTGGAAAIESDACGLLPRMAELDGEGLHTSALRPEVVDFYERTSAWHLEAAVRWSPWARPFGLLIRAIFADRLQQLGLPLRDDELIGGIDSRVVTARAADGTHVGSSWIRTLRSTGATIYSGWYGTVTLPGHPRPSVRVVFPLPNGSVTVFLRPEPGPNGSLLLRSPVGAFGDDGAYLVVRDAVGTGAWVRRIPIAETFAVFVDAEGALRTRHDLSLRAAHVVRFDYLMSRNTGA